MASTVKDIKADIIDRIKNWKFWAGGVAGAVAGYAYNYYVGCASGTCPITSNPYISVLYGALAGFLLIDTKKKKDDNGHKQD